MKKIIYIIAISFLASSCYDLNLSPLSEGAVESWFKNQKSWKCLLEDYMILIFGS